MKNYIFLLNALTLTSTSLVAMESNAVLDSYAIVVKTAKKDLPGVSSHFMKTLTGVKLLLETHQNSIKDPQTVLQLSEEEKETLVKGYQSIHFQLTRLDPAVAKESPLRNFKQLIYTVALKLFTCKQAAKQWLKSADFYTDEEKDLDTYNPQGSNSGYSRSDYYAAKRSLNLQTNRLQDTNGLEKKVQELSKESDALTTQIEQLTSQLAQLEEQKGKNGLTQKKIKTDLQATNRTIRNTETITSEKLKKLELMLKSRKEETALLEKELALVKEQSITLAHEKKAQEAAIALKSETIAQLKLEQAAIARDIDLLNGDYTLGKKLLWKFSGFLTNYPVEVEEVQGDSQEKDLDPLALDDEKEKHE